MRPSLLDLPKDLSRNMMYLKHKPSKTHGNLTIVLQQFLRRSLLYPKQSAIDVPCAAKTSAVNDR